MKHSSKKHRRKPQQSGATPRKTQNKPNSNFFFFCLNTRNRPSRYLSYSEVSSGWSITWLQLTPLGFFFFFLSFPLHRSEATVALGTEGKKKAAPTAPSSCPIFFPLLTQASLHLFCSNVQFNPLQFSTVFAPLRQLHWGKNMLLTSSDVE